MVGGDVGGLVFRDDARPAGEGVPDAGRPSGLGDGPSTWHEDVAVPQRKSRGNSQNKLAIGVVRC